MKHTEMYISVKISTQNMRQNNFFKTMLKFSLGCLLKEIWYPRRYKWVKLWMSNLSRHLDAYSLPECCTPTSLWISRSFFSIKFELFKSVYPTIKVHCPRVNRGDKGWKKWWTLLSDKYLEMIVPRNTNAILLRYTGVIVIPT